jgi:hypothetical protein
MKCSLQEQTREDRQNERQNSSIDGTRSAQSWISLGNAENLQIKKVIDNQ